MMRDGLHINADDTKRWWLNGRLHRTDGPAVEYANGDKMWYLNGRRHREDGPAIERADGNKIWYLNGQEYSFDQWLKANTKLSDQQRVMFKLAF
jgi:hypothetical protein